MLAQDILTNNSIHNTLSGRCIVEGWEGDRVRVLFPSGFRPLVRPAKLINGLVLDYHTLPDNVKRQLEESGKNRYIAHFYDGSMMAFPTLSEVASYTGLHLNTVKKVYQARGYSSVIASVRDVLN